jgi:voltage-gated potassium channel
MAGPLMGDIEPRERNKLLAAAAARSLLTTALLLVVYYIVPVHEGLRLSSGIRLLLVMALFVAVLVWQIRRILNSKQPGIRAIEALAVTVPLFLLLFAGTYFVLSVNDAANFSQTPLTRTDTLYFTVTIFSTVGFGDITATSETARLVVTLQMILNLVILGVGINALTHAAKVGRQRQSAADGNDPT